MYHPHTYCRSCHYGNLVGSEFGKSQGSSDKLIPVFSLGVQPMANDFRRAGEECAGYAPLEVLFCPRCTLAQLSVVVRPDILYANYPYITSRSRTMTDHFQNLWQAIGNECKPDSVVEIGSNDGHFLKFCREHGADAVIGIDPAENLKPGSDSGIFSICGVFDETTAITARSAMPPISVVVARHVFAHIDDWHAFVKNLDTLCHKDTLVVIEVPYVMDLLRNVEFDTIYHEHLSYVSIRSIEALLDPTSFHIHKVLRFDIHGGAIAIMIRRNDWEGEEDASVSEFLDQEKSLSYESWKSFNAVASSKIDRIRQMVNHIRNVEGVSVCGFGASAKSTVWVNACGFTARDIAFICDSTPQKQWRNSPGSGIPIVDEGALLRDLPSYSIMFSWNFCREILETQKRYTELGGKFIVPFPYIQVLPESGLESKPAEWISTALKR